MYYSYYIIYDYVLQWNLSLYLFNNKSEFRVDRPASIGPQMSLGQYQPSSCLRHPQPIKRL